MFYDWLVALCADRPGDLTGSHDPLLVLLSIAIAAFGSYTALDLAGRIRVSVGAARRFWIGLSATAMGGSIWSMHFVAMLAFRLETPISYDVTLTLLSLLAAIAVSAVGLGIAGRATTAALRNLLVAGTYLGLGVATMHYTGMAAMQMDATLSYEPVLFALSIVIAVAAGSVALWLAFTLERMWQKLAAGIAMAAAIAGMHYTAMAAAHYTALPGGPTIGTTEQIPLIAVIVAVATFGVLALGLLSAAMARRFAAQAERESDGLRESEHYLRDILDNAQGAYVAMDEAGTITDWNTEATRVFGWERGEALGRALATLVLVSPNREILQTSMTHHLETGTATALDARIELMALRRDGTEFSIEMTLAPVKRRGRITFHAFMHDITRRKTAERDLILAKEMAESSNRAKSQFLAHMSHELRTPLNAIIGFSEIIRDRILGPVDEQVYRGYAGDIHSSGQHLLEVINDVLDLSKAEAGYLDIKARPFKIPDMLGRCADTVRELARKVDIDLTVDTADDLPLLMAEERRIRQVVLNLLSNAVKFTPAGGKVALGAGLSSDGDLQISVEDTGIGMTPEQAAVAVTPFGQVENHLSRRYEGAGLGLPLAKRFTELHGGRLHIDSTPDVGTKVTVTLPASSLRRVQVLAKTG